MWSEFQKATRLKLMDNPIDIIKPQAIMSINSISEHNLKNAHYTIILLTESHITTIELYCLTSITSACGFISIHPSR